MSTQTRDMDDGTQRGASPPLVRAAAADLRADRRLAVAIDDFFLPDEARLDDRLRAALTAVLADLVGTVEIALRQHGARLLAARDAPLLAETLAASESPILDRLVTAGMMRDPDLMRELIGRVRQDVLAESLPVEAPEDPDRASLLARLSQHADGVVATSAVALLAAES